MPEFLDLHGKTNKLVRALADAAMQRHGLHLGQDHFLAVLWEKDGQTPGEIAAALNVSTPTVVKAATRMAAIGLVTRRAEAADRRLVRLWLTSAGRRLRKEVEAERRDLEAKLTVDLTAAERKALLEGLAKVGRTAAALLEEDATRAR